MPRLRSFEHAFAIAAAACTLTLPGCQRKGDPPLPDAAFAAPAEPDFSVGEQVLVETARATFFEAVVRRPGKTKLQVDVPDAGAPREVDAANVYPIGRNQGGATLGPGAFAICRVEPLQWVACRVDNRTEGKVTVLDEAGNKKDLEPASVLKPSPVTELNLKQSFEQAARRKAFLEGAREAGRPLTSKNWSPKPGESVLVLSQEAFRSARVQKLRRGLVFAVVEGEGKEPRTFPKADVFPQPPVVFTPEAGSYACVRPAPGDLIWPIVRIQSSSSGSLSVSDSTGQRRTVDSRDVIPLTR